MRDYYISATIRHPLGPSKHYRLWSQRIKAPTMGEARAAAVAAIASTGHEFGELHILTDEAPVASVGQAADAVSDH